MPEPDADLTPKQEESDIFRESYPQPGDRLFKEGATTETTALVDCIGYSNTYSSEPRSPIGRWGLYTDGFLLAGDRLVESFSGPGQDDALLYPILALYRHHLELELKELIGRALNHSVEDQTSIARDRKSLSCTHGLKELWSMLQKHFPRCREWAVPEQHAAFEALLFEFNQHDDNSQAARYPWDKGGCQTLTGLRFVDVPTVKASIHKMSNYLWCFHEGIIQANEPEVEI